MFERCPVRRALVSRELNLLLNLHLLHETGDHLVHDTTGDTDAGENGGECKSQSPRPDVCKDETSDESGQEVDNKRHFLRDTLLNQIYVSE